MTLQKTLIGLFISGGLSYASSLAVYQDKTFYNTIPSTSFIGFTKGVSAKCEGSNVSLLPMTLCPKEARLCEVSNRLDTIKQEMIVNEANIRVLEKFISLPQPTEIDASQWILSAKLIGEEQAMLGAKKEVLMQNFQQEEALFRRQAPSKIAQKTETLCSNELTLTIPYGHVSFSTSYEANLEEKQLTVTQNLSILNRSGVDIQADTAMFYYRSASQYVRPIHFSPWIVSKYEPRPRKMYKKSMAKSAPMMELAMEADSVVGASNIMPEPTVSYEDAREYKIKNLNLPSTGLPLEVKVLSWTTALECEVKAYPYRNTKAFHVCSFTPKYQIDSNSWKVTSGKEVINEHAVGEYRKEKYNLYTKIEDDIQILRKPIVKKERQTGIFGGTARKQDGFTLTLTNKSNKIKELTLIERIPTSTTTEISSKLVSVKSKNKIEYKVLKDGQIEMSILLSANETQKIDVLFEIAYDKDLKVNY